MKSQMGTESGGENGSCGTHDGGVKTMVNYGPVEQMSAGRCLIQPQPHDLPEVIEKLKRDLRPTVTGRTSLKDRKLS